MAKWTNIYREKKASKTAQEKQTKIE